MSITIHWGGNGSCKSGGVMMDYIVPAATQKTILKRVRDDETVETTEYDGRVVVTNMRGVSLAKFYKVLGDDKVLPGFDIIFVDTDTAAGRDQVLKFWHWVPHGALLVFDECNMCFPGELRDSDLAKLKYRTLADSERDNRPHEWLVAWEQHRHYNWDIVLMCPNIKSVRMDIRNTTEGAYHHTNMAVIGIKGRYMESYHSASDNGGPSAVLGSKIKRVPGEYFSLYRSTKTGFFKDTLNGSSMFRNPRLLIPLAIVAICLGMLLKPYVLPGDGPAGARGITDILTVPTPSRPKVDRQPAAAPVASAPAVRAGDVADIVADPNAVVGPSHPFEGAEFSIAGYRRFGDFQEFKFQIKTARGEFLLVESRTLVLMGYRITAKDRCMAALAFENFYQNVFCAPRYPEPPPMPGQDTPAMLSKNGE